MNSNKYPLSRAIKNNSSVAFGCMGLGGTWDSSPISAADINKAHEVIDTAIDAGITLFDHADIYTFGKAEQVFGEVLKARPELLELISIQSKCAINPIETHEYPLPANRPHYSVFNTNKIRNTFDITIPHWKESLKSCLKKLS